MSNPDKHTTSPKEWEAADKYFNNLLIPKDDALDAGLAHADASGLPNVAVSAAQGKFLHLLARSIGAKRVLEVGTLGGYANSRVIPGIND